MKNYIKSYEAFLVGKVVDLAVIDMNFIKKHSWHTWLNDHRITRYTKQGYFPLSKKEHYKYVQESILSKKRLQLGVIKKKNNCIIGNIRYFKIWIKTLPLW